ncbi:hypothetical protein PZB75_00845 [Streptomyces sp. AM 4-1-1]|uniref:hypothetical protein n=1 Tax=Streptomyces sp. AM 4-1-1 TaxID=3028710 RepID=UPI0023B9CE42|nr:hypothetical protein [Streptomyces sp. AM 4-1-1]WEH32051.1 hypothetical protein PZB75_00845 [Streptomyces sp. AM 4-1-1]
MRETRPTDPVSRGFMRSVDRMLVWSSPVLAVVMAVSAVAGVATGAAVGRVLAQFALAFVMVCTAITARARLRRDEFPEERKA